MKNKFEAGDVVDTDGDGLYLVVSRDGGEEPATLVFCLDTGELVEWWSSGADKLIEKGDWRVLAGD